MAISSPGIGSGLDVNTLVTQLVASERAPADTRLSTAETSVKSQISAFGALRSALSGLESALKRYDTAEATVSGRKATPASDAGFGASATATAAVGSYRISVERLATAHKLQSAAAASDAQVGHGTLSIAVGSDAPIEIDIASGSGTLAQIRDAINAKAGGVGVVATVVKGDAGDVLFLASTRTGTSGALTVTASGGDGGLGVLATSGGTMTQASAAQDAQVVIDGITRTSSSNTVSDAIDGVSLTLTKAAPGTAFTLDVAADASTLKAGLLGFVSAYNTALAQLRTQGASGGVGKTAGPLGGDAAPRSITASLRGAVTAGYAELSRLGFKTAVDGSLSLDGTKFDAAIAADPLAVRNLFGAEGALGKPLRASLAGYVGTQGMIESRTTSLNDRMKSITRQKEALDTRMTRVESTYRAQFTALDSLMAKMQSMSTYLTQQLSSLSTS